MQQYLVRPGRWDSGLRVGVSRVVVKHIVCSKASYLLAVIRGVWWEACVTDVGLQKAGLS